MKHQEYSESSSSTSAEHGSTDDLFGLTEQIAERVHVEWARNRERDNPAHPNLVPYAELSDGEKAYDRATALVTVRCIREHGYRILPPSPLDSSVIRSVGARLAEWGVTGPIPSPTAELERLASALQSELPEAAVLYCTRLLEHMTTAVLHRLGDESMVRTGILAAQLGALELYGLLEGESKLRFHFMRRSGNRVRHGRGLVAMQDARDAVQLLASAVDWFFRLFGETPSEPWFGESERFSGFASEVFEIERIVANERDSFEALQRIDERIAEDPSLSDEPRVIQMRALALSRSGVPEQLSEAIAMLKKLRRRPAGSHDDELLGILAGAYKRKGLACARGSKEGAEYLGKALACYAQAWSQSHEKNAYHGINVAALSAWRGEDELAVETAGKVCELCEAVSAEALEPLSGRPQQAGMWRLFSLAEARALRGLLRRDPEQLRAAAEAYSEGRSIAERAGCESDAQVARRQLQENLRALYPEALMARLQELEGLV